MIIAALTAALAAGASGCGSSDSSETSSTTAAMGAATMRAPAATTTTPAATAGAVTIRDFTFLPRRLTVRAGTKVTFTNDDSSNHTATSDDDGVFDSGNLSAGGAHRTISFARAGTFAYHCDYHPSMHGTVVVTK